MKRVSFILSSLFFFFDAAAQSKVDSVYTYEKLSKSLRFAQLTLGGDILAVAGGQSTLDGLSRRFGTGLQPRVTIGGLHFWGHADFYVTFPLLAFATQPDFASQFSQTEGVETGLKIYPWAIRPGRLRPYAGISFQPYSLKYRATEANPSGKPARYDRFISPIQAGLTYATRKWLFMANVRYYGRRQFSYYESPTQRAVVRPDPIRFSVGVLRYIDTDLGLATSRGIRQQNIMHHILKENKRLDAWYFGVGPSAALQMSQSPYFKNQYPYLVDQMLNSFLIPDLSLGRYFSKPDLNVGLSTRSMFFRVNAFDTKIRLQRHSFALESYKFLFNYHGFVPFVGPMISMEYLSLQENGLKTATAFKPAAGVVFGWDIRVTKTGTSLLRTNLRYAPRLRLKAPGDHDVMFNHLEFNFIQYVTFIGRKKLYRRYSK